MRVLIDGYNLLHASGLIARGKGERALEQARNALLEFLAEQLAPHVAAQTTVVYDASAPPSGLPAIVVTRGITVEFAVDHDEADDRLDELIRAEPAPQKLWVITSDHRIQETARRRGAHRVDSDVWYDAVLDRKWPPSASPAADMHSPPTAKPDTLPDPEEVRQWLDWFSSDDK